MYEFLSNYIWPEVNEQPLFQGVAAELDMNPQTLVLWGIIAFLVVSAVFNMVISKVIIFSLRHLWPAIILIVYQQYGGGSIGKGVHYLKEIIHNTTA
jgi:hypothetical protein